jgi:YHS domain-containing protein
VSRLARCTVCGFEINNANPKLRATHNGREYEFCCPICKGAFEAVPERFAERAAAPATR